MAASSSPRTILVVDDVPANLGVLTAHLEAHGYYALVAQGGQECIERARFVVPDLILLDVMMPGMDGFETCRQLKADERTRDIPVIFMTALTDSVFKVAGFEAGAVDYVTKPLDGPEVLARIEVRLQVDQLQRELQAQNERLQREVEAREAIQQALQRSNSELEQLAYVASHDMQEPLRMIASYLQLLAKRYQGRLDAEADEFIGYAVDGAKRMQALINDLLAYSRINTKAKPFGPTDLGAVAAAAIGQLRLAIEESNATVHVGEMPAVQGDALQLTQLLQNLIGNAIKFRHGPSPKISIEARRPGNDWEVSVSDNGIGIAREYFERIFVLFQRLHGRTQYPGTGIGLAICKKIVERHGGRIWVESTPDIGSVFHFTLPAAQGTPPVHKPAGKVQDPS